MSPKLQLTLAFAAVYATGALAQSLQPPEGRPVTAKDIIGKKICWDSGHSGLYAANGEFSNDRRGNQQHKWSVPEPGVIQTGDHYRQAVVLPDGRLASYSFRYRQRKRPGGAMDEHFGAAC